MTTVDKFQTLIISFCSSSCLMTSAFASPSQKPLQLFNAGRFQEALPLLAAEVRQHPKDATIYYYLAGAYAQTGNNAAAVENYNACVKCDPQSPAAKYSRLALLNYVGNQPAESVAPPDPEEHAHAQAVVSSVNSIRRQANERIRPMRYYARGGGPGGIDQSASNLERLLDSGESPSGVSLKAEGTNLYVRNYKTPPSIYLKKHVKKGLVAPQDKLILDGDPVPATPPK